VANWKSWIRTALEVLKFYKSNVSGKRIPGTDKTFPSQGHSIESSNPFEAPHQIEPPKFNGR
jgi:hypothetical protein